MDEWIIYFNPKCGSCRKTLELLNSKGITPRVVEYLKTPPTAKELDQLSRRLNLSPLEMMRTKEPIYEKLKLSAGNKSRAEYLQIMAENPILLQRPIVVRGQRAVIARPPENANVLFNK